MEEARLLAQDGTPAGNTLAETNTLETELPDRQQLQLATLQAKRAMYASHALR